MLDRELSKLGTQLLLEFLVLDQRDPGRLDAVEDPAHQLDQERLAHPRRVGVDDADRVGLVDEVVDQQAGQQHRDGIDQVGVGPPAELAE
jgi:hypothetical protein